MDQWDSSELDLEYESSESQKIMGNDMILLSALIPAVAVLIIMCLLSCLRCRRRHHNPVPQQMPTTSTNIYTVPTNYCAVDVNSASVPVDTQPQISRSRNYGHHRISSQGDRFMVPLDLLPTNFNYNAPGVVHKGDHVLIKDLKLLELPSNDEYQKQLPYNPNFV